jgi:hypothetical protein
MTLRLSQVNARLSGKKTALKDRVTELYKLVQKPALFNGNTRIYTPYQVAGDGRAESVPPVTEMVQARVKEILASARKAWTELLDGTYTQDIGNTRARADIVVDGQVLAKDVPVTTLMYLKKIWEDVCTFLAKLPTPDPSIEWVYDENQGYLRSKDEEIVQRTKKVPKTLVKFEPTERHPGQADVYQDEVAIGDYARTSFTGGCPYDVKASMIELAGKVRDAIKVAHEAANLTTEVEDQYLSQRLFDFVFAPLAKIGSTNATP